MSEPLSTLPAILSFLQKPIFLWMFSAICKMIPTLLLVRIRTSTVERSFSTMKRIHREERAALHRPMSRPSCAFQSRHLSISWATRSAAWAHQQRLARMALETTQFLINAIRTEFEEAHSRLSFLTTHRGFILASSLLSTRATCLPIILLLLYLILTLPFQISV